MFISCMSPFHKDLEKVCSKAKIYKKYPKITIPKISAKCIIPDIKDLENKGQYHKASSSKRMN